MEVIFYDSVPSFWKEGSGSKSLSEGTLLTVLFLSPNRCFVSGLIVLTLSFTLVPVSATVLV